MTRHDLDSHWKALSTPLGSRPKYRARPCSGLRLIASSFGGGHQQKLRYSGLPRFGLSLSPPSSPSSAYPYYHRPRVSPCHHRARLAVPPPSLLSSSPSPSASPLADSSFSSLVTVDLVPSPSLSESSPSPWLLPSCRYRHPRRRVVFAVLAIVLTAHLLCPRPRP